MFVVLTCVYLFTLNTAQQIGKPAERGNSGNFSQSRSLLDYTINRTYRAIGYDERQPENRIKFVDILAVNVDFFATAITIFTTNEALSVHYLIPPECSDSIWTIYEIVPDSLRAFHAGSSYWQGYHQINNYSIGIGVIRLHDHIEFSPGQIKAASQLLHVLKQTYNICDTCIVGHSDISPYRIVDFTNSPGPKFPWKVLYDMGIGFWPEPRDIKKIGQSINSCTMQWAADRLDAIGYNLTDRSPTSVWKSIKAFQIRFRNTTYDGMLDKETCVLMEAIVQKYFPDSLSRSTKISEVGAICFIAMIITMIPHT